MATDAVKVTTFENTKLNVVKLNWKEVYYTNCPLVLPITWMKAWALPRKSLRR